MDKATKDLTKLIDQLLILQRENPGWIVSAREKQRLETAVHYLLNKLTFSSKAWELIKPFNPEPTGAIEQRKKDFQKSRAKTSIKETRDLNRDIINETEVSSLA
jgi:hypothetical protein